MTIPKVNAYFRIPGLILITFIFLWTSCKKDILEEKPLSFLTSDNALTSKTGFDNYIIALHAASREEMSGGDTYWTNNFNGTGMYTSGGSEYVKYSNYSTWLTPSATEIAIYWNWAYS